MTGFSDILDEPAPAPARSFAEDVLGSNLASQNIEDGKAGFVSSFKAGLVDDPQTQIEILARDRFPDDPKAAQRFGVIDDDIVFINEDGKLERARGGFVDALGGFSADAPEIAAGTAASIATKSPVIGGALGGVVGKQTKQIANALIFDEPQTTAGNLAGQAKEFGFGLVGGLVGEGFTKFLNRNVSREGQRLSESAKQNALREIEDVQRETGISLDLAQVTNFPLLKAMKKWAAKFPGKSSEILEAHRLIQDGQAEAAVTRIMEGLATETDATQLGIRGMNAARAAIEGARIEAAQRVSPLYKQAFAEAPEVDPSAAIEQIQRILPVAKGKRRTAMNRLLREFEPNDVPVDEAGKPVEDAVETGLEALHNVKMHIDSLLESDPDVAIDKFLKADLTRIKERLVKAMGDASPLYDQARLAHGQAQEELVNPLVNSLVGTLARMEDGSALVAASKMFNNRNVSPAQINNARQAILAVERQSPELAGAWDGLVKQWLEESFTKASKEVQSGQTVNFAGKFRQAVFGTDRQKLAMHAALGVSGRRNFNAIMDAFQMMARTPIGGSDTAFNQLVTKELAEPSSVLRTLLSPRNTVIEAIDDKWMENNAERIATALTNPAQVDQLKQLTKLPESKERALRIVTLIMGISGGGAIDSSLQTKPESTPIAPDPTGGQAPTRQ